MKSKKIKVLEAIQKCLIAGAVVSGLAVGGCTVAGNVINADITDLKNQTIAKVSGEISQSKEYVEHVKGCLDVVYSEYREGQISTSEFSRRCEEIRSNKFLLDYARGSQDQYLKGVMDSYDTQIQRKDSEFNKVFTADLAAMGGCIACGVAAYNVDKKKKALEPEKDREM